jgi:hypothetical protein
MRGSTGRQLAIAAVVVAPAAFCSPAHAAVSQAISAAASAKQSCFQQYIGKSSTSDAMTVSSGGGGLVSARISGGGAGDWDLAVFDRTSGRVVAGGASWSGDEVAEGYVEPGANLAVQACRYAGGKGTGKLTVGVASAGGGGSNSGQTVQVVDVRTETRADKRRLQSLGLDLTEHGDSSSLEAVLHNDNERKKLRDAGFTYRVRIADLAARMEANKAADAKFAAATSRSALPSGRTSYRHLWDYDYDMKWLASQYPTMTRLITLPLRTSEGRPVHGIEITKDAANAADGKPVFLQMGVHHAREWPSSEHAIEFGYDLLVNYAARRTLVDATRTIVVPIVNRDGFNVSREAREVRSGYDFAVNDHEMKRKTCFGVEGVCGTANRLAGIDPNRNYGGNWGAPGAGTLVHDDTFRGDRPFQAPEVENIRRLVSSRQVVTLITNHTYSNLVLRPPGLVSTGRTVDEPAYRALGAAMTAHNRYANMPSYGLYDTSGTTEDWTYYATGGLGFTFEIGPDEFHPPYEKGVVDEYLGRGAAAGAGHGGNQAAYYAILAATADPAKHSRITGSAPTGTTLKLSKTFQNQTAPVIGQNGQLSDPIPFTDTLTSELVVPKGGTFTWNVNPSTRPSVMGTYGRNPDGRPQQPDIRLANPPGFPPPNPNSTSFETVRFTVDNTKYDNGKMTVHLEWANARDDWDIRVLKDGVLVTSSESYGDNDEDAFVEDPESGEYVVQVINWAASGDWDGTKSFVHFDPPTPGQAPSDPDGEAYTITCGTRTRDVKVARGQAVAIGNPCG